jgi:metal-dependent amidase/aminoacylase/carboxypeptidase family protein
MSVERSESIFAGVGAMLDDLEELYKDVHRHPELSMQEERTAGLAAERLQTAGFEVTTGVWKDRRCRPAPQRRRADGDAAR